MVCGRSLRSGQKGQKGQRDEETKGAEGAKGAALMHRARGFFLSRRVKFLLLYELKRYGILCKCVVHLEP